MQKNTLLSKVITVLTAACISVAGISFVQNFEGTKYKPYMDSAGVLTVCTGSTTNVVLGKTYTYAECLERFEQDLKVAQDAVRTLVRVPITQNMYDALVSFVFNVGVRAFETSSMLRLLNTGDYCAAGAQFKRWVYVTVNGRKRVERGLVTRRAKEAEVFLKDVVCTLPKYVVTIQAFVYV